MNEQYFSKRTPQAIAWQVEKIINNIEKKSILVGIKSISHRSGSEVFVYTQDKDNLFAALTATLNQKGLSIQGGQYFIQTNKDIALIASLFWMNRAKH